MQLNLANSSARMSIVYNMDLPNPLILVENLYYSQSAILMIVIIKND